MANLLLSAGIQIRLLPVFPEDEAGSPAIFGEILTKILTAQRRLVWLKLRPIVPKYGVDRLQITFYHPILTYLSKMLLV